MIIQQPIITASISGDNIKSNTSGSYIGFEASSSHPTASNELVFGLGLTGSGNNTVTIGNTGSISTHLYGALYRHKNLIGDKLITHRLEKYHLYTISGSFTASLPLSPNIGDSIKISNFSTNETGSLRLKNITPSELQIKIERNGENIMGLSQDMNLDQFTPSFELIYTDNTKGWVIISS